MVQSCLLNLNTLCPPILQNTMLIHMLKDGLANQVTDNGHLSDWIDTALNKNLCDDIIESWFKVACECNMLEST